MKNKFDVVKLIGFVGVGLGMLATFVSNYAQEKRMEETIEEKVNEALAKRDEEESV